MDKTLIIFTGKDANDPVAAYVYPADKNINIYESFMRACCKASDDHWKGFNYELPEKYLKAEGLSMEVVPSETIALDYIGTGKVQLCECRECSAYEDGSCSKYGGLVDGFSTGDDCLHGTGGFTLVYDDETVSEYIFRTDLSPKAAVDFILSAEEDDEIEPLKDDLQEFIDSFDDPSDIDDTLWDYWQN